MVRRDTFLKKYRFDDREYIQTIHTIKKYFSTGGIPIILPLLTKSGDTIVTHNNSHYALFPFVEGNHFARGDLPKEAIISLGEMLGKIHLHGKDGTNLTKRIFSLTIDNEKALGKIERLLEIINQKNDLDEFDILAKKNLVLKKELILNSNLTNEDVYLPSDHLIHGDYHDRNVFFDASNNVSNVFDLEKSVDAPRTFELLRSMTYALLHDSVTEEKLHDCKIYYDAYRSIYPLPDAEL